MIKTYRHLNKYDRHTLFRLRKDGMKIRRIAEILGFSPSTISRELKRNQYQPNCYSAIVTNPKSRSRRFMANHLRRKIRKEHHHFIREQLILTLSPEQIASLFLYKFGFSISTKSIYRYIYKYAWHYDNLEPLLRKKSRIKRTPWRRNLSESSRSKKSITQRPKEASNRSEYGHWEMDLFLGPKGSQSSSLILVERKSLYSIVSRIPNRSNKAITKALKNSLKGKIVHSITTDNGPEFLNHKALSTAAGGADIYYCAPYAAWQKGLVENTVGLYRHFFPKKTPLPETYHPYKKAQTLINNRPRKTLNFKTSASLLDKISLNY